MSFPALCSLLTANIDGGVPALFCYERNFAEKRKLKLKVWKWTDFRGFSIARKEGENSIRFLFYFFQCVTQNIDGWLIFSAWHMVYSQIWLNLPWNDCHFFYIFLICMIPTLAKNQKFLKKYHWAPWLFAITSGISWHQITVQRGLE